jgi:diaminobutyrate-2-oxoglutarate transaminase
MNIFSEVESEVRTYCRQWPVVFDTAVGCRIFDEDGREYLDFFAGAGALNYGHNPPRLKRALIDYLERDGIIHSLDMHTHAKAGFLEAFQRLILEPRGLAYRVQFPGPTGTNAVEAALKLARKVTGRTSVVNFTNSYHGMSLGSLAVTGSVFHRDGAGVALGNATPMPFDQYLGPDSPHFQWFTMLLDDPGSSLGKPAAVIVETVQGEGGLSVAGVEWLRELAELCRQRQIVLIVDDVQMGVGRTGPFFSFEVAGIQPDIVCLSKAISGSGLPMALTLIRPELDQWSPGEHNGTFRGNNAAFVTATAALEEFWADEQLEQSTLAKGEMVGESFRQLAASVEGASCKGRGLARGIRFEQQGLAAELCAAAFQRGLLLVTAGARDEVMKAMPPLTISDVDLKAGLSIIEDCLRQVCP